MNLEKFGNSYKAIRIFSYYHGGVTTYLKYSINQEI